MVQRKLGPVRGSGVIASAARQCSPRNRAAWIFMGLSLFRESPSPVTSRLAGHDGGGDVVHICALSPRRYPRQPEAARCFIKSSAWIGRDEKYAKVQRARTGRAHLAPKLGS